VKHQILFERSRAALLKVLGECGLVPGASDVAGFILGKSQLAVMVLTAMLEWTTQHHYTEMFRPGEEKERLDPGFLRIFKAHWLEEAQHAKLDNLETERLAKSVSAAERDKAIDEVLELGGAFDGLLKSQAELDIASLERACGRTFTAAEKAEILARQHRAYRYTFLVSGLTHKSVIDLVGTVSAQGPAKFAAAATALSA
jgi:hypothetical protein